MAKSIKKHILDRLGNAKIRKLLILLNARGIVICRDFFTTFTYLPPIKNPQTFNEKINWIKLYRKDMRMVTLTDKVLVRGWVAEKIGVNYLIPLLGEYKNAGEFIRALPSLEGRFVVKATNGGGGKEVILCEDKTEEVWEQLKPKMDQWLLSNTYLRNGEWQYKKLVPRILCERMIDTDATDYKFFCFHGKVRLIQVDSTRFSGHKQQFFDLDWNQLPIVYVAKAGSEPFCKPDNLQEMQEVAEKLSEEFDFVRVDLYNVAGRIYFGEMTFTPNNGLSKFKPVEWDRKLGEMWNLDKQKKRG